MLWYKTTDVTQDTGWVEVNNLLNIASGYNTVPSNPVDLAIGAGGPTPGVATIGWGDHQITMGVPTPKYLYFISTNGINFSFDDFGNFTAQLNVYAGQWIGSQISSPSDSNADQSFDFQDGRVRNLGIGGQADHTSTWPLQVYGKILSTSLTPSTPLVSDSSKAIMSGQIDLGSSTNVKGTGLSAGQILSWNGSEVAGVSGVNTTITGISSGPFSTTVIATAALSGTIPPGLTLTTTSATVIDGFATDTHTVTDGVVTS